ncbi:hypothetical protein DB347_25465 [Opitutaceae bacterium EW11]|nr:hypothetical protein DB347_25465 [Opitutaceae bacterium EW11]
MPHFQPVEPFTRVSVLKNAKLKLLGPGWFFGMVSVPSFANAYSIEVRAEGKERAELRLHVLPIHTDLLSDAQTTAPSRVTKPLPDRISVDVLFVATRKALEDT